MPNYQSVPRSDSGGPSIEPAVLRRLRSISPGLTPVWRNMMWDPWNPDVALIAERGEHAGSAVPWPGGGGRWLIFHDAPGKRVEFLFVLQTKDGAYHPLDGRVCDQLVTDLARTMDPSQIAEYMQQIDERSRAKIKAKMADLQEQKFTQNRRKTREAMASIGTTDEAKIAAIEARIKTLTPAAEAGDIAARIEANDLRSQLPNQRAPSAIFYPGQDDRRSSAEKQPIPLTAEQEGWELPDLKEELHGT